MIEIVNRKAKFEYLFLAEFSAGIMLTGTEIKSIRNSEANLRDAYCLFIKDELYVKSLFIAPYKYGNQFNHEPRRDRKLLLKATELKKLLKKVKERGFTIVPFRLFINENGLAKLEIALAQGKNTVDKRQTMKERQNKITLDRVKKDFG